MTQNPITCMREILFFLSAAGAVVAYHYENIPAIMAFSAACAINLTVSTK